MHLEQIKRAVESKRSSNGPSLGVAVVKPHFTTETVARLSAFCSNHSLHVVEMTKVQLSHSAVVGLYPDIFRFGVGDLRFGITWKQDVIDYMTSSLCIAYIVEGALAIERLTDFKRQERERLGKLDRPNDVMERTEFVEKVIKNALHVVDEVDVQNALWLLQCCVTRDK